VNFLLLSNSSNLWISSLRLINGFLRLSAVVLALSVIEAIPDRIALVGCDTTNIKQGLARNFAKTIYDNMPALRTAQITGRGGELEVNENGTKTMKTGGTKTLQMPV
jgi:hypothetical protein